MRRGSRWLVLLVAIGLIGVILGGCAPIDSADEKQRVQTEQLQQQAQSRLGMPNIRNFYEKSVMKQIMEECDKSNLITYAYIKNEMTGKLVYLGQAVGYGLPYGTQYTNPNYIARSYGEGHVLPQPDPNGLYKAENVSATWIMLIDSTTGQAKPVYVESDVVVSQFKLPRNLVESYSLPDNY